MTELKRTVRRAAHGNEEAAAVLFDDYYPRVFRYALGRLGSRADAEDVAAETFARVVRDLGRFKWKGGGFEAWIFRIASNLVVDHVRRVGRERPEEDAPTERLDATTPEHLVLAGESAEELDRLLSRLGAEQREVLTLRFGAGLDTLETGKVMGRKPNAVRQLQYRALDNLRQMLSERAEAWR